MLTRDKCPATTWMTVWNADCCRRCHYAALHEPDPRSSRHATEAARTGRATTTTPGCRSVAALGMVPERHRRPSEGHRSRCPSTPRSRCRCPASGSARSGPWASRPRCPATEVARPSAKGRPGCPGRRQVDRVTTNGRLEHPADAGVATRCWLSRSRRFSTDDPSVSLSTREQKQHCNTSTQLATVKR